ncbi:MAG: LacI family DNA-binding transcriptional regulator [Propionibacteriaceae bacterium]|nr:LacI family DNA-binding transcriptional regulator [Propionibacteriaceae bacterium]
MTKKRAPRAQRPRMADIADVAKVSTATVSRVLNGKPGASEDVRQAVLAAMDMLGYERPVMLRAKSEGLVGVIVAEFANPIFAAFAQAIEIRLARQGYGALLCSQSPGGTTEEQCISLLLDQGARGIIFVSGLHADAAADHRRYSELRSRGIAQVFVNGYAEDIEGTFISIDEDSVIDVSMRHLVSLGHQRIGLAVGPNRFLPSQRKAKAFGDALRSLTGAKSPGQHVVHTLYTLEGGQAAATRLLESGHTAIVCGSDLMALGAIRAARALDLRVPEDVSIVGYDDSPTMAFVDPPLTTVRQPVPEMSAAAVSTLLEELDDNPAPRVELLFRGELVVRGSTGAMAESVNALA